MIRTKSLPSIHRPTFLGIGAPKAGTSWLHKELKKHPDIWMPYLKELHYFDRSPEYISRSTLNTPSPFARFLSSDSAVRSHMLKGLQRTSKLYLRRKSEQAAWMKNFYFGYYDNNWYQSLFSPAGNKACGEITPSYSILNDRDVAEIRKVNPDMKIIFMVRNPVDRAWSQIRYTNFKGHNRNVKSGNTGQESDEDIIKRLKQPGMTLRGDYERTLDTYLKHFNREQILICFYDAIQQDPLGLMADITGFLGIRPFENNVIDSSRIVNASPKHEITVTVKEYLTEQYAPMIERMAAKFGSYADLWNLAVSGGNTKTANTPEKRALSPTLHP